MLIGALLIATTLALLHSRVYAGYRRAAASGAGADPGRTIVVGAALFACYVALLVMVASEQARWPSVGSRWALVVLLGCIGAVYQLLLLGYWGLRRALPHRRRLARVLSIVGGLGMSILLGRVTEARALGQVRARHAGLLSALPTTADPCAAYRAYLAGYAGSRYEAPRSLHTGPGRQVLTFLGGSIDIDGSTIVLDSASPEVHLFHNDNAEERQKLDAKLGALQACP